ncbi:hypothetical protein NLU13_8143 [Sarocladium strictum]|uniref:beta-glucosidase n=1 Tax=Sarocladium strictum TaxID=5046 RepID=A0AA39GCI7_SARSR|nr:hypothetical protein NLU13_8143 [Sarocladium strictum]
MVAESLLGAPYWDATLPVEDRVADLLSRMTLEEKAGQMFHWMAMLGPEESFEEPIAMMGLEPIHHSITERLISHYGLVGSITDVRAAAQWHNNIQRLARSSTRLGIPITVSSDPRHHFHNNVGTSSEAGALSQWPETLGLAALRDPAVTKRFAEVASAEYRALGIRCALHPQIDLATEYRWSRINGTFGEDAELTSDLVEAYIEGFQGGQGKLGSKSVACMIKHFPGGGPLRDGEDSHFSYGKIQQYPGGQFDYHLRPFVAALKAGAAQVMPAYGMPTGVENCEEVAFGFNKYIITDLLRHKLGFNGVVVTDWGLVTDHNIMGQPCSARAWGVEHLSRIELVEKILNAGCDQLGGEKCVELIIELVQGGRVDEARINESVARILRDKFLMGLFDNPFVDEDEAVKVVGQESFRIAAAEARKESITLLETKAKALPFHPAADRKSRVYTMNVAKDAVEAKGLEVVDNFKDADLAIIRLQAPFETRSGRFEAMFHAGSLDFPEDNQRRVLEICQSVPTIVDVYLDRPAVLTPFVGDKTRALFGSYGSSDSDFLDVVLGKAEPLGKLPFDLPRSMAAVEKSRTDVAFDTEDALFSFGHGLEYKTIRHTELEPSDIFALGPPSSAPGTLCLLHTLRAMDKRYVRIQAAKPSSPPGESSASAGTKPWPPKRRRTGVTLACDVCRRKKIRCDGARPACASCSRAAANCNYSQRGLIEAENARDASTLQMLRSLPPSEAGRLLDTIRTNDEEEILRRHCPTLATTLWSYLSPNRNKVELELMIRHPIAYPPLFPLEVASLPLNSLFRPSRILVTRQDSESPDLDHASADQPSPNQCSTEVKIHFFPPRPLVREELQHLQICNWTNVHVTNDFAARMLSLYIETDYHNLPMLNLDLFLDDLINNKPYFCSRLLVNSLFSWVCQSYSAIDPKASELGNQFFEEAQSLVLDGPQLVTLTSVSALGFLALAALSLGHDALGLKFLQKGVSIGTDMGIFGRCAGTETANSWLGNEDDWRRSASYVGWGFHNFISLYNLRYRSQDLLAPPGIPMPGKLDVGPPQERIATGQASIHTQVFKASCELWVLSSDVCRLRLQAETGCRDAQNELQELFMRCLSWASSLSLDVVRNEQSNHAVAMMHIYYHIIVVDIFREVFRISKEPFRLPSFETPTITPRAIYTASVNQLKRLLLAFRLSFKPASISLLPQTVYIYVANAVLSAVEESEEPEWQFYLRVCLAGLEDIYGSYRLAWGTMRALLSMALKRDAVGPDEAARIMREMTVLGQHHSNPEEAKSSAIIDLELATSEPAAAQVYRLAEQFEELLLMSKAKEK